MELVSIVMAVYKPNFEFFKKQLISIDNQTYENIEIIIRDDSFDEKYSNKIEEIVKDTIKLKKYTIIKNSKNLGSNKTFEKLTVDANGKFIAYCDQDDIWEADKIDILLEKILSEESTMVYSDLSVIDENDYIVANSLRNIRKRLKHIYGYKKFKYFLRRNSVTGCTMLIKSDIAKKCVPFPEFYIHDQWLALNSAINGKISYTEKKLVRYRIHSNNQVGTNKMVGIRSKKSYVENRLIEEYRRYDSLYKDYSFTEEVLIEIKELKDWTNTRIQFFTNTSIKNIFKFFSGCKYDHQLFVFEILLNIIPESFQNNMITAIKKTKL